METNGRDLNGRFSQGHPGFKKAGLPEFQRETRERLWAFFQEKITKLPEIFDQMSPNNQSRLLLTVAEFFASKQREIFADVEIEARGASIDYTKLSEATLKEILKATTLHENGKHNNGNQEI